MRIERDRIKTIVDSLRDRVTELFDEIYSPGPRKINVVISKYEVKIAAEPFEYRGTS